MRILYCITSLGIGGAEAITIDIANRVAAAGHYVTLLYLTGENKQVGRIDGRLQVIGLRMLKNPVGFVKAQQRTRDFIKQ